MAQTYLDFTSFFPSIDATEANVLVTELESTPGFKDIWAFTASTRAALGAELQTFPQAHFKEFWKSLSTSAAALVASVTPVDPANPTPQEQVLIDKLVPALLALYPSSKYNALRLAMESYRGTKRNDWEMLEAVSTATDAAARALQGDDFFEALADYYLITADQFIAARSVTYRFLGRVLNTSDSSQPKAKVKVTCEDLHFTSTVRHFGSTTTNHQGYYRISFTVLNGASALYPLRFKFTHSELGSPQVVTLDFDPADPRTPVVSSFAFTPAASTSKTIASTSVAVPADVQAYLASQSISITRLEDIRRLGSLKNLPTDTIDKTNPDLKKLDGLASLELIQQDVAKNNTLYTRGYESITDIALAPQGLFVEENSDLFGDFGSGAIHYMAKAAHMHGVNQMAAAATAAPIHDGSVPSAMGGAQNCDCPDCKSGVSPLAYLADLLSFTKQHIRVDDEQINWGFLQNNFKQSFTGLRASCSQMKEQLCQNRIAAEVLRAYLQTNPPDVDPAAVFDSEEKEYLMQAYELLLGKLGTSYAELRIARASTDEKALQRLADRMGVIREDANGPTLEQLLIDLSDPANIVEGEGAADPNDHPKGLEKLFGLRDTVRDVFDGTPESKVEQWKKAKLREDWVKAHKLSTPFWRSSAMDRDVIIDPDVVTIDDLRHPSNTLVNGDPAPFNIWKKRREWIDAEWAALDGPLPSVTPFSAKAKDVFSADKIIVAFGGALPTTGSALVYTPFGTATNLAFTFSSAFQGNGNTYFRVEEDIAEDMFGGTITIGLDVHSNVRPIRNCAAMIERLTGQATTQYAGAVVQLNWPMNFSAGDVIDTIRPLVAQAASGSQSALTSLKNRHLDLAMAQRFLVLYDQNKAAEQDFETEGGLSQDEWAEFKSIMIQMLKNRLSEAGEVWRTEENSGLLSPIHFRAAIHAPRVGNFPGLKGAVLIDPDDVTERGLPEVTVLHYQNAIGTNDARQVLVERREQIVADRDDLIAEHASSFQDLLDHAFVEPGLVWNALPENNQYLALLNDLANAERKGWAVAFMTLRLRLSETELRQVISLGTKEDNGETLSVSELNGLYNTLNRAYKQLVHLSPSVVDSWVDLETGVGQWKLRKAALPLWRASQARRDAWLNALAEHSERPIIDADLIGPAEMKMPEDGNVAYGIFNTRWQQMHGAAEYPDSGAGGWLNEIAAFPLTSTTEFNTVTKQYLGFVEDSLFDIREQEADGTDIRQRIAQLNLTPSEFNRLMACYDLLAAASTLTAEEKSIVHRILAQVQKRREFYAYRRAETEAGLTLSQDHFKLREQAIVSFPPKPDTPLTQWLAEETDLILWRRMLKGRVEQEKTVLDAWHEALFEVDEAMMVHLRDAMIKAVSPVGQHPVVSARNLGDLLLIDLENNCCFKTNRVAAAIETVQQFLWKTRTGDILANYPDVRYQGEDFDEAWTWMGSYSNWRAAMFVFLYPENVLHPSLRKDQTPAFREVVNATRNNRRFGPGETCNIAHEYERYLLDLQSMEVACAQQATAYTGTGPCGTANNVARTYEFIFAKAKASGRLYYSITDTNDIAAPKQVRFWGTIPGLEDGDLVVHGCDRYLNNEHGIDHIYLFVTDRKADDKNKFFSLRFSLQTMLWDEGTTQEFEVAVDDLHVHNYDPLPGLDEFDPAIRALCVLKNSPPWESSTIALTIRDKNGKPWTFARRLNAKMDGYNESYVWDKWMTTNYPGNTSRQLNGTILDYWYAPTLQPGTEWWQQYVHFYLVRYDLDNGGWENRVVRKGGSGQDYYRVIQSTLLQRLMVYQADPLTDPQLLGFWYDQEALRVTSYSADIFNAQAAEPTGVVGTIPLGNPRAQFVSMNPDGRFSNYYPLAILQDDLGLGWNRSIQVVPVLANIADPGILDWEYGIIHLAPRISVVPNIGPAGGQEAQDLQREVHATLWELNSDLENEAMLDLLNEVSYFVPMQIALQLQTNGHYQVALDWFRSVYDFTLPLGQRKISMLLWHEESLTVNAQRLTDWYADPLNPHAIAATRRHTYTRYTILAIVYCLLDYADAEFTTDNSETVPRARELYEDALELMKMLVPPHECPINEATSLVDEYQLPKAWRSTWVETMERLEPLTKTNGYGALLTNITNVMGNSDPVAEQLTAVNDLIDAALAAYEPKTLEEVLDGHEAEMAAATAAALGSMEADQAILQLIQKSAMAFDHTMSAVTGLPKADITGENIPWLIDDRQVSGFEHGYTKEYISPGKEHVIQAGAKARPAKSFVLNNPFPNVWLSGVPFSFCVVPNPIAGALVMKAEVELFKIHNCMNIAGMVRELDPFAAPTDSITGIPVIGAGGGSITIPNARSTPPSAYRYRTIVERARQLVGMAQQVEAAFLATLEKLDAERYSQLRAEQDIETSKAHIKLQDLKLNEAETGIGLAKLQRDRAQLQVNGLQAMIDEGLLGVEELMIANYLIALTADLIALFWESAKEIAENTTQVATATVGVGVANVSNSVFIGASLAGRGFRATSMAANTANQIASLYAAFERRKQEWEFQRTLAQQDIKIGDQQVKLAEDRKRVVGQERQIAVLQNEHARATLDFLKNKFTSAELYEWMSKVLEDAYAWFLQEATAMAILAERQLAFERQLDLPPFIRSDYWIVDGGSMGGVDMTGQGVVDRRGLTGSARLLKDLTELDQYAFSTNSPKLQLTKTSALSELAPEELIALRDTGVARFYTTHEMFDRDFPGHYLRLIKRVSVTVIALTPPTKGIRATLTNGGGSHVVVGGTIFQERVIKRFPEVVAFSSGVGDHGVFRLQPDGEFLHPFEGSGVETGWEFRMEKAANPFDYNSIADVLFTIEYEALNSFLYRNTVAQRLNQAPEPSAIAISLKNNLPDQWFDLHNPQEPTNDYQVSFQIGPRDIAPNLSAPYSLTRAVAYAIMKDGSEFRYLVGLNRGAPAETLAAFSEQGLALLTVPTDPGDGPIGTWDLAFAPDGATQPPDPFANKLVEDIFIILTYEGESTPYLLD